MDFAFWKVKPVPKELPEELTKMVAKIKAAKTKEQALEIAHRELSSRYRGYRGQTYLRLAWLFRDSISVLNSPPGFLHCTHMNYLLMSILIHSGWFKADDFRFRWTLVFGISPHQYALVRVGRTWTPVDVWGASYGVPLGDYSHWFHVGRLW